jgi:hypothetical protein
VRKDKANNEEQGDSNMKKTRSNARWAGLTAAQRKTLETWLFEEQINYEEALRRATETLNFKGSVSSIKRFYARRYHERLLESMGEEQEDAQEVADDAAGSAVFRTAGMKLAARAFFHQVREKPGNVKEWSPLAKLMLWSEDLELRRTLKAEENQLRRERLEFARERFQFNIVEKALKMLPELQELAEARKDPKQREYEEGKRVNAVIRRLFGSRMAKAHAESPEEEAAMEEAKRRQRETSVRCEGATADKSSTGSGVQEIRNERKTERARAGQVGQTLNPDCIGKHRTLNAEGEEKNKARQPRTTSTSTTTIGAETSVPRDGASDTEHPSFAGTLRRTDQMLNAESGTQEIRNERKVMDLEKQTQARAEGGSVCMTDEEWARRNRAA